MIKVSIAITQKHWYLATGVEGLSFQKVSLSIRRDVRMLSHRKSPKDTETLADSVGAWEEVWEVEVDSEAEVEVEEAVKKVKDQWPWFVISAENNTAQQA
jgi:hypothetical protein